MEFKGMLRILTTEGGQNENVVQHVLASKVKPALGSRYFCFPIDYVTLHRLFHLSYLISLICAYILS
jgi:hypothetical protein